MENAKKIENLLTAITFLVGMTFGILACQIIAIAK